MSTAQYSSKVASSAAIYVLGLGNLGRFFAHSLRKAHPELPITLLFHRQSLIQAWNDSNRSIDITTNGQSDNQKGFEFEVINSDESSAERQHEISNLIVATKTYATKAALSRIAHRMDRHSTLLFVQNGMGKHTNPPMSAFAHISPR
jgi:2-dehydropantoate 2-reductase